MSLEILSQNVFYTELRDYLVANQDKISDLNSGSVMDAQFQVFANKLNAVMVKCSGGFKQQFEQIPFQSFNFQRNTGASASGTVVFSRQNPDLVQIDIPIGTVVSSSDGLKYTTQDLVSILSGNTDSGAANITAQEEGSIYNKQLDEVTIINSTLTGVNAVTNNTIVTGGLATESNTDYFTRFQNYVLGLGKSNDYGIWTAATTVDTIQSAFVKNHFPPVSQYNFTVYVDDGSGNVSQSKLDEIILKIRGNNTAEFQGYAGAGVNFRTLSAGLIPITVAYTAKIDPVTVTEATAKAAIDNAIQNYINALWIGSDVILSEINKIIKTINGVLDVEALTLNGNEENVIISESEVARTSTITGTITT